MAMLPGSMSTEKTGLYSATLLLVTSMRSIFFTLTYTAYVNNMNYMHSGFEHRGLKWYCVLIGGLSLNADWVFIEAYTRAVNHKMDGKPTLSNLDNY